MMWYEHPAYKDHRKVLDAVFIALCNDPLAAAGVKDPVLVAVEQDDGSVSIMRAAHAEALRDLCALGHQDYVEALQRGLAMARKGPAAPLILLAVNARGRCAVTCIGETRDAPAEAHAADSPDMVTAEQLWAAIAEGVASDPTGPMAHMARRLADVEQGEGGEERRKRILQSIDTLKRYLMADPEVADAIWRGDTQRVAQALSELGASEPGKG